MSIGVGQIVEGKVTGITHFGAFVELIGGNTGLVHISEVADSYVKDIKKHLKINEKVSVKVIGVDEQGKISLSIKQAQPKKKKQPKEFDWNITNNRRDLKMTFEDKLSKYMKESEEKHQDIKKNKDSKRGSSGYSKKTQNA